MDTALHKATPPGHMGLTATSCASYLEPSFSPTLSNNHILQMPFFNATPQIFLSLPSLYPPLPLSPFLYMFSKEDLPIQTRVPRGDQVMKHMCMLSRTQAHKALCFWSGEGPSAACWVLRRKKDPNYNVGGFYCYQTPGLHSFYFFGPF